MWVDGGRLFVAMLFGFFLPGYVVCRAAGRIERLCLAVLLSQLLLFHTVFVDVLLGGPISFFGVLAQIGGVTLALTLAGRYLVPAAPPAAEPFTPMETNRSDRLLLYGALAVAALLGLRCAIQPLSGYDAPIRWDLLAGQLLSEHSLDFYPPTTSADFRHYGFVDGLPPLVSIGYWWLYAAVGQHAPAVTSLSVLIQFACLCALTFMTTRRMGFEKAAGLSVVVLCSSPLLLRSVGMGQETGWTAVSLAALVYFLLPGGNRSTWACGMLAGLAAAVGMLSREYCWAFLPCGWLLLWLNRHSPRAFAAFTAIACLVTAPWYIRTFLRTGNPFYSLNVGDLFPVNTVFVAAILQNKGVRGLGIADWSAIGGYVLRAAPFQVILGIAGAVIGGRRMWSLLGPSLLVISLWLISVSYASGGVTYAARMLTPAVVLLSVSAAQLISRLRAAAHLRLAISATLAVGVLWGATNAATIPLEPQRMSPREWLHFVTRRVEFEYVESRLPRELGRVLPKGARVLTDNPYAHAALLGSGIDAVLVWSPDVSFLFDARIGALDARRMLAESGIRWVLFYPAVPSSAFLRRQPFYRDDMQRWKRVCEPSRFSVLLEMPP